MLGDINGEMLRVGRDRMTDRGNVRGFEYVQCNAEALPFPDASFDLVTIAFGLRNVTDKDAALREMHRVLKVGGQARVLEFSEVKADWFKPIYDFHSFKVLPALGKLFAGDARQLSIPGRIDPPASAAGRAEGHDGNRRLRTLRLQEPQRRHRRHPHRLQGLTMANDDKPMRSFRESPWRYSQFVILGLIVAGLVKWLSPLTWLLALVIGAVVAVGYLLFEKTPRRDLARKRMGSE